MPRSALALLLAATLGLAACDAINSSDDITGVWTGSSSFEADTVIAESNLRVFADYGIDFQFALNQDDGLVDGSVTASWNGFLIFKEAGQPADTINFSATHQNITHEAFGTFIDPVLEVDVPDGPYEENLWTFEVSGRRAESESFINTLFDLPLSDGSVYAFDILSEKSFDMRHSGDLPAAEDSETEENGGATTTARTTQSRNVTLRTVPTSPEAR